MIHKSLTAAALCALFLPLFSGGAHAGVVGLQGKGAQQTYGAKHVYGVQSLQSSHGSKPGFPAYGKHAPAYGTPALSFGCSLHTYCAPTNVWVPGQRKQVEQQIWIPAKNKQVWIGPVYRDHCDFFGNSYKILVKSGHYAVHFEAGHFETIFKNSFSQGYWKAGCQAVAAPYGSKPMTAPAAGMGYGKPFKSGTKFAGYGPTYGKQGSGYGGYGG
jgi:hypothetical protein